MKTFTIREEKSFYLRWGWTKSCVGGILGSRRVTANKQIFSFSLEYGVIVYVVQKNLNWFILNFVWRVLHVDEKKCKRNLLWAGSSTNVYSSKLLLVKNWAKIISKSEARIQGRSYKMLREEIERGCSDGLYWSYQIFLFFIIVFIVFKHLANTPNISSCNKADKTRLLDIFFSKMALKH